MVAASNSPDEGPFNLQTLVDALSLRQFGKPVLKADEGADDSDKSFTVPSNTLWEVRSIWVELVTTATAGNRQMIIEFQDDSADIIAQVRAGDIQSASKTRNYLFAPGVADLGSFRGSNLITTPIPNIILPESYVVRVVDTAAVDAAADDMVVQMMVAERVEV